MAAVTKEMIAKTDKAYAKAKQLIEEGMPKVAAMHKAGIPPQSFYKREKKTKAKVKVVTYDATPAQPAAPRASGVGGQCFLFVGNPDQVRAFFRGLK